MKPALKKISLFMPEDLSYVFPKKEIFNLMLSKSIVKAEYFRSKAKKYEEKYKLNFLAFKKKVESTNAESFAEWDDLLLWEGYEKAYMEWKHRSEELFECLES